MHFRLTAVGAGIVMLVGCAAPSLLVRDDSETQLAHTSIRAPNPGEPGSFAIRTLIYGAGTDRRRPEYGASVALRTTPVNATPFLRGSDKKRLKVRWDYWGFDEKRLPLNARVWFPEGRGPFPLVLIVHGNHSMKEFSDPGYQYLGEQLASRGYILVSVDENFLNGDLRGENDARAWMLLQHLSTWRRWASDSTNPFYHKADLSRIALMGHSRGGESVAIAAAFNRLTHYPDDARITFNFGFQIRSVIAIAPVDVQYKPADRATPLLDVNYFVIHGSHDSDVQTFMGLRQYERVRFTSGAPFVKAAVYIYRANHGQFNSVWGDNDVGDSGWLLNKSSLLSGDEQRQAAKVFIGAFLDLTLMGHGEYLPMFRDYRAAGAWLPKTIYLSRFDAPTERLLADFEEDIDVTTGSGKGVTIAGQSLSTWREAGLSLRSRGLLPFENNVAVLGWNSRQDSGGGARAPNEAPTFTISIPDSLRAPWLLSTASSIVFSLADYGVVPSPLAPSDTAASIEPPPAAGGAARNASKAGDVAGAPQGSPNGLGKPPLDLTVELVFADGRTVGLPLSSFAPIRPPLTVRLYKYEYVEQRVGPPSKNHDDLLAKYVLPLSAFADQLSGFDASSIRALRFRFDRGPSGTILLDDIGFDIGGRP